MLFIQKSAAKTLKTTIQIHSIDSNPISIALKEPSLTVIHNSVVTLTWDLT